MKKRLAVVLCAAMMLSACGGASTSDKTADTKDRQQQTPRQVLRKALREMESWSFLLTD